MPWKDGTLPGKQMAERTAAVWSPTERWLLAFHIRAGLSLANQICNRLGLAEGCDPVCLSLVEGIQDHIPRGTL